MDKTKSNRKRVKMAWRIANQERAKEREPRRSMKAWARAGLASNHEARQWLARKAVL